MISTFGFVVLSIACAVQIVFLIKRSQSPDPISHFLILGASLVLFAEIVVRSIKIQFVAVTNTFESLIFFAGAIGLVLFIGLDLFKDLSN